MQITVDVDRTVVAFYKFLKKHASIPFQLQKPTTTSKTNDSGSSDIKESQSSITDAKDELWELKETSIYEEVRQMTRVEWLAAQQRK